MWLDKLIICFLFQSIYKNQVNSPRPSASELYLYSGSGRILTERVPINLANAPQDYSYNPLQYSNYRYERIYNEPNPIYTHKPITLDDAIEEISRRFVLVPKTQGDVLYPLPDDRRTKDYERRRDSDPKQRNSHETYPQEAYHYNRDKNPQNGGGERLTKPSPKYYDDYERGEPKILNGNAIHLKQTAEVHSSNDDSTEGSGRSDRSDICNEKYYKDKDDSTEKSIKGKLNPLEALIKEKLIPEPLKRIATTEERYSKETSDPVKDTAEIVEQVIAPLEKEVKQEDLIKSPEISHYEEEKEQVEIPDHEISQPTNSTESIDLKERSDLPPDKTLELDDQLIENEPNALHVSNEHIDEDNFDTSQATTEQSDSKINNDIRTNYDEGYEATEQGVAIEEQQEAEIDLNQQVYPAEYNPEQYVTGEGEQQAEYDPNQANYNAQQYAANPEEQPGDYDPNQQYNEEYQTQEGEGQYAENIAQEAPVDYDPNQQYYDQNAYVEGAEQQYPYDPNYVDPAAEGQIPATEQYYAEGEISEATNPYPGADPNYVEDGSNNYPAEYLQEGSQNDVIGDNNIQQTYDGTEGNGDSQEAVETTYEGDHLQGSEIPPDQSQETEGAVYPNTETSEDTNLGQTYEGTEPNQYEQNPGQDNSQYYDETITGDPQPHTEEQTPTAQPLKILESDTEPDVSKIEEPSKQESDFDFSVAQ